MPRDLEHQPAVAAAELEDAQRPAPARRPAARAERASEDPARAHERVDAAQVAARALRHRIVGREVVERLRLEDARQHVDAGRHRHSTRSSAPWQLKPAPNDDSHHQPAGAPSASAASSTK